MEYQTVKKASDVKLEGISVELTRTDGSLKEVVIKDGKGGLLRIAEAGYNMYAYIPAVPKLVKKFRLSGTFAGLVEVSEAFDDEYSAKNRLHEYERKHSGADSEVGLVIESVEVPEEV